MALALVPTLEVAGPSGQRVLVAPRSLDDKVGELADALGVEAGDDIAVDGRRVTRHESLGRAGLVRGSMLAPAGCFEAPRPGDAVVVAICEAGPAAGSTIPLPVGRHVVGRSPHAAVRIDDPQLEVHHAVLDVAADATVAITQVTGRVPCRIDGAPVRGTADVPAGSVVALGASRLTLVAAERPAGRSAVLAAVVGDPWRRTLRRRPRPVPRWAPEPIAVPEAPTPLSRPGIGGLAAAVLTALGAVVASVVIGSPLFLIVAAAGLVASVGIWAVSAISAARTARGRRSGHADEVAAFAAAVDVQRADRARHHRVTTPSVTEAVRAAVTLGAGVWARRADHPDVHRVSIGWGTVDWDVAVDEPALPPDLAVVVAAAAALDDVPVPVELGPGAAVAVCGVDAPALARALVVQAATWTGPADLQLVVVAAEPASWDWCCWLPHAATGDGARVVAADEPDQVAAVLAALDDGTRRHVLVVTDRAEALSQRTGPLRRFLGSAPSAAVIVIVEEGGSPPAMCRSVLEIGSLGHARWWVDAAVDSHPGAVHIAGVTTATATAVARALARLQDPEEPGAAGVGLEAAIGIGALYDRFGHGPIDDPIAIAAGWRSAAADPAPIAALGAAPDGVVEIDLARDGPHALIAGTTGSGKSELLRTLVVSLAARSSPDHLTFVLVDYKGGATFDACADLPHTVGIVTDLDERLAERALVSLEAEVRRREQVLRSTGAVDLTEHRARGGATLPRLVVVVDEFATLAAELPDFLGALVGVAQRGRSLGIHLVLATQRPAGVVSDDIRANTNLRIGLRLQDVADARDVVGDDRPATFPRGTPGRAILRLGADEHVVFQAARSSAPAVPVTDDRLHVVADGPVAGGDAELTVLVGSIRNAAALSDIAPPRRPWLPPLPDRVDAGDLLAVAPAGPAVGILDDPAGQCRRPLRWSPEDGNLAIIGAVGTGTTTALRSAVIAATAGRTPDACHVYVVDAGGDDRLDELAALAHCGAVVRPHERERLSRLLRRLAGEVTARRVAADRADRPAIVLAVDRMAALRSVLDDPLDHRDLDLLHQVVTEGPAAGVATVMTAERPAGLPGGVLATCGGRWIGRLDDPSEASACGVPAWLVPSGGPGRFVVAGSRLVAQVAVLALPARRLAPGGPPPVDALDPIVTTPPTGRTGGGETRLTVGVDFESLAPAVLAVPDGEHVLVAGPARSGRTTALDAVVVAWRHAHPDGTAWIVAPRAAGCVERDVVDLDVALSAVDDLPEGAPGLLAIDDAERVDDARLGPLAAERRRGLLIVAAGRPDALRTLYGHWTAIVRRSRLGILLAACADVDGDVLGELLPRRPPITARPGLAWLTDASGRRLAQVAAVSRSSPPVPAR